MLRQLLAGPGILLVPGAYDGLSALLVEQAGFPAMFLSGASLAYARLGRPDVGLTTASELADACGRMADRVSTPIVVDADSGHGNAVNLQRTVRMLERAGAAAVQIEDQAALKPVNAIQSRPLVPVSEMVGRIKAAQDARSSEMLLISARTDAQASVPFAETLERCNAYVEAGCDALLAEGLTTPEQVAEVGRLFGQRVPLIHNLLEGGASPFSAAAEIAPLGFRIALMPGAIVQTMARASSELLAQMRTEGSTLAMRERMFTAPEMAKLVGAPQLAEKAQRWS